MNEEVKKLPNGVEDKPRNWRIPKQLRNNTVI
jgi:hypothetical protein